MMEDVHPGNSPDQPAWHWTDSAMLRDFVRESNRIEGIVRPPTKREISIHAGFLTFSRIGVTQLSDLVWVVAQRHLREHPGMDVRVGDHLPPRGGPEIRTQLDQLCANINDRQLTPYEAHQAYEHLHPFMDGNGRSGRALWLWHMLRDGNDPYILRRGFLHTFYYQALSGWRAHKGVAAQADRESRDAPK